MVGRGGARPPAPVRPRRRSRHRRGPDPPGLRGRAHQGLRAPVADARRARGRRGAVARPGARREGIRRVGDGCHRRRHGPQASRGRVAGEPGAVQGPRAPLGRLPRRLRRPGERHVREPLGGALRRLRRRERGHRVARRPPAPRRPRGCRGVAGRRGLGCVERVRVADAPPRRRVAVDGHHRDRPARRPRRRWCRHQLARRHGGARGRRGAARERGALPGARPARLRHGERDQRRRDGPIRESRGFTRARPARRVRARCRRPRAHPRRRSRTDHAGVRPGAHDSGPDRTRAVPAAGRRRHLPDGRGGGEQPRRRARGARSHRHRPRRDRSHPRGGAGPPERGAPPGARPEPVRRDHGGRRERLARLHEPRREPALRVRGRRRQLDRPARPCAPRRP